MSVKCEIQFPDSDKTVDAELSFEPADRARPQVIYHYQIGYLEHPKGDRVYRDKECKALWFVIRKTK